MAAHHYKPNGPVGRFIHSLEESVIALILGIMTLITFVNVVLRYVFNSALIWGLEVTLILFAWLVLLGISYGFKVTSHLGVDALVNLLPTRTKRALALLSAACCLVYALLLFKGAWDYWAPFAALPPTSGRWLPTGFTEGVRDSAASFMSRLTRCRCPGICRWHRGLRCYYGDPNTRNCRRVVPYLPFCRFSVALILLRIVQASWAIWRGSADRLVVSHEVEDADRRSRRTRARRRTDGHVRRLPLRHGRGPSDHRRADCGVAGPSSITVPAAGSRIASLGLGRAVAVRSFRGHFTLLAIPFFILASSFMTTGGVARRIIRFSIACVGHLPGGLAIAGVFACMMFAALSGSSPATVVAIGSIVIAGMRQVGYTKEFAAGVICNAGTLGILIPPSIVMVVYAAASTSRWAGCSWPA